MADVHLLDRMGVTRRAVASRSWLPDLKCLRLGSRVMSMTRDHASRSDAKTHNSSIHQQHFMQGRLPQNPHTHTYTHVCVTLQYDPIRSRDVAYLVMRSWRFPASALPIMFVDAARVCMRWSSLVFQAARLLGCTAQDF